MSDQEIHGRMRASITGAVQMALSDGADPDLVASALRDIAGMVADDSFQTIESMLYAAEDRVKSHVYRTVAPMALADRKFAEDVGMSVFHTARDH